MCDRFIVPPAVLRRFADDESIPEQSRDALRESVAVEGAWRQLRDAHSTATHVTLLAATTAGPGIRDELTATPAVTVYDCQNTRSLPGTPIPDPGTSSDATAQRAYGTTRDVVRFYRECFGRNSVDDRGMTLMSSIHYGVRYANAFWNGAQMTYGDGDGRVFTDFTASDDVICHELTHGVTQFSAGLDYTDEPGALNESISDVFGAVFHQWRHAQTVAEADWLIGSGVLGPAAIAKGYNSLRNLANPGARTCLSPQPSHYRDYIHDGDPHDNSGIPNHAFYLAAQAIGDKSWEKVAAVWYAAVTDRNAQPSTNFRRFADLTRSAARSAFPNDRDVYRAVDDAWTRVGVTRPEVDV